MLLETYEPDFRVYIAEAIAKGYDPSKLFGLIAHVDDPATHPKLKELAEAKGDKFVRLLLETEKYAESLREIAAQDNSRPYADTADKLTCPIPIGMIRYAVFYGGFATVAQAQIRAPEPPSGA